MFYNFKVFYFDHSCSQHCQFFETISHIDSFLEITVCGCRILFSGCKMKARLTMVGDISGGKHSH
jgi:hypothetical protein